MQDFSEDQDVDKALQILGLDSINQKYANMTVSLMPHQILGCAFMLTKEKDRNFRGGLLCDAMGLGKVNCSTMVTLRIQTIQTIGAIAGNPSEDGRVKSTLIVAPLAVISQ
jgi:SNF2 family DNA or RNA helicase